MTTPPREVLQEIVDKGAKVKHRPCCTSDSSDWGNYMEIASNHADTMAKALLAGLSVCNAYADCNDDGGAMARGIRDAILKELRP